MRDGRERSVPHAELRRQEKQWLMSWHHRMREAARRVNQKLLRHDRALLTEHNRVRTDEAFTAEEIAVIAHDLNEGTP